MKQQLGNKKLGRGLSSLLGGDYQDTIDELTNESISEENIVQLIDTKIIVAGVYQPRKMFSKNELENLSQSIKEGGIIQPLILRKSDQIRGNYEIIAGERRFRAAEMAGFKTVPAIIRDVTDNQALEMAIVENIQRADLNAIEEADSYQRLIDEFGYKQDQIAQKIGRSRSYVTNSLRLLKLPAQVRAMVEKGDITAGHARTLINNENAASLAKKIAEGNLSVRDAEELAQQDSNKTLLAANNRKISGSELYKRSHLRDLASDLSRVFDNLEVKISYDNNKKAGRVTISYQDLDKIEKIISNLKNNKS